MYPLIAQLKWLQNVQILVLLIIPSLIYSFTYTPSPFNKRRIRIPSAVTDFKCVLYSRTFSLLISTPSKQICTFNEQNNDDNSSKSSPPPLFTIDDIDDDLKDGSSSPQSFHVQDMSPFQNDIDVEYEVDYDDENLSYNNLELHTIHDNESVDNHDRVVRSTSPQNEGLSETIDTSQRNEDDMLMERESRLYINEKGKTSMRERCVLVGVEDLSARYRYRRTQHLTNPQDWEDIYFDLEQSLEEMGELILTSGMEVAGVITQRMNEVNPRTYIGTGKVKEIQELLLLEDDCCTVIFDAELSPGQQKSLENIFNKEVIQNDFLGVEQIGTIKIVDRTALILDIFAQHAKTREGKLQVDLALHEYRKPRLTRMWTHLERQSGAGGVGLRGPGESQLEIDRRLIRDRIIVLKRKIDSVQKQRDIHRRGRSNLGLPVLALVGYTNAGKSTLLNHLTNAGVMAENILFATLDPTTRKVKLPGLKTHPEVLLTDTVGFIQKLPTQLVAAFRATLEEVKQADVLIHVIDSSNPVWEKQERAVKQVLTEIGCGDKPIVRVLNKIDQLESDLAEDLQYEAAMMADHSVAISAISGDGIVDLVSTIEDALMLLLVPIEVLLPYTHGKEVNIVQEVGHIEEIDYRENGTFIVARVPKAVANRLRPFSVHPFDSSESDHHGVGAKDEIDWIALGRGRHKKNAR